MSNKKFWNFVKSSAENMAELVLYGDISRTSWWGDEVTPQTFNAELKALGDVDEIVVRINSGGGDVFAAAAIYARLKEHKAKITVKIDGWAASAATTIAMAGDEIKIANNALFMIHDPMIGLFGYYNASEMGKMQEELGKIKSAIISAYEMKTKKTTEEISDLMSNETWYTASEAVEAGFVDSLMFDENADVAIDSEYICVNGVKNIKNEYTIPEKIIEMVKSNKKIDQKIEGEKGEEEVEIKSKEELRAAYPDWIKEIENDAKAAERKRIKEIEDIEEASVKDICSIAKYETLEAVGDVAIKILNAKKKAGADYLAAREKDVADSGVEGVEGEAPSKRSSEGENDFLDAIDRAYPQK